ncbi:MAG: elongation factor G [Planctomycetia bacterium]|nr:MAG: elongation factor G [Planctomycetia bacterium]
MGVHQVAEMHNVAFVGHAAAGKTTLGEAILHKLGVTSRLGNVDDGTSVLDFDDESRERRHSTDSSLLHFERDGKLVNIVVAPGMPDYAGPAISALAAVETAIVCVSAVNGIGVNTRRMFNAARDFGLARMIVITKIDHENANLDEVLASIRDTFGAECHPINLPADSGKRVIDVLTAEDGKADILDVKKCHTELLDSIVEIDDSLMEEYMGTGTIPPEKLEPAIGAAVGSGHLVPVLFVNSKGGVGIDEFLEALTLFAPSPVYGKRREIVRGEGENAVRTPIEPKLDGPFIAQVVKLTSDPKSNIKYAVARVYSGTLKGDGAFHVGDDRKATRPGHIFKLRGAEHHEIPAAGPGDIVAFAKLDLHIGQILDTDAVEGTIPMPRFPTPMFSRAIESKSRGDIDKIGAALRRFEEEDPCFRSHRDAQTHELVIEGMGDLHLAVVRSKIKRMYKLDIETHAPKIPYRETVVGVAKGVEYTHKKQSGGAGQYARVFIDLEPNERGAGYEFQDKIFGGVIDQAFRPSVDKGIREQLKKGVIAGYPVVDVKVSLVDGKTHPVDSKDIAFQIAGRQAFKKAFATAKPILLEPVVNIEVNVPAQFVGDIARDIAGKRGQVVGQDVLPGNQAVLKASVPLAEVANYSSQLKSVTGGQGSFSMELSHYDIVPPMVQQQIVASYKPHGEEEE